jgi:ribose transport system substrate-binding protein
MIKSTGWWCRVAAASCVALAAIGSASGAHAQQKLKVYVSTGFDGNTWMNASTNLLRAIAQTKAYKDRVTLEIQSARGDAQTQLQQINAMTQAGPISLSHGRFRPLRSIGLQRRGTAI